MKRLLRFPPVSLFFPLKPDTETRSFFNVSELHKLKIIYMYLLYPKEYCDINQNFIEGIQKILWAYFKLHDIVLLTAICMIVQKTP